jgi:hypothetical protein
MVDEPAPLEQSPHAAKNRHRESVDVIRGRSGWRMKGERLAVLSFNVNAVKDEDVEVQMKIQRASKPLYKRYGACLCAFHAARGGLLHVPLRNHIDKNAEHRGQETWVSCHEALDVERHREDPLADGDIGQHVVNQVCARIRHSSCATARTDPTTFAGEGHQNVRATTLASCSGEATGKNPAIDVLPKLLFDVSGKPFSAVFLRKGKKREKVFAHHAMKKRRLWSSPLVAPGHCARLGNPKASAGMPDSRTF